MSQAHENNQLPYKGRFYTLPPEILVLRTTLFAIPIAVILYLLSRHYFLLYHGLVEFFIVTVAFTIFSIGWNARHFVASNSLMVLAVGHLALCPIQTFHVLSYKGLNVLPITDANPATQLWVAGRYIEALTFLAAALMLPQRKRIPPLLLLGIALGTSALLMAMIWPLNLFPDCFVTGSGLTSFKIASEYVICILLGIAMLLFWRRRGLLDRRYLVLLMASIFMSITAELSFTLYQDVYGFTNFLGHFFKLAAVVFLYRALISGALRTPYSVLFGDLSRAKEELDRELEQRRQTEKELREANKELDAFARTVSHDLRTPLTPIIGLADYLQERLADSGDQETLDSLRVIEDQGKRMVRILTDLLAFSRTGHLIEGNPECATVEETLEKVLEDLGGQIVHKGVEITHAPLPASIYPRTVMFMILSNLLSNAIKYGGGKGSRTHVEGELGDDDHLTIRVIDHGAGIPPHERDKVFELFYRQRCHDDIQGTGIGLATVKKLSERLEGRSWVEETPGGGATFIVELPPYSPADTPASSSRE